MVRKATVPIFAIVSALIFLGLFPIFTVGLTLRQAIHQTLTSHPDVLSNRANVVASKGDLREARGGYYPHLDVEGAAGRERSDNPATRAATGEPRTFTRTESEVIASQLLFDGGNTVGRVKERTALLGASKFRLAEIKEILAFAAAEAFLDVKRDRRLLNIARKDVVSHRRILNKISKRLKAGAGRKSEVQLAQSRLALAQAKLERRLGNLKDSNDTFIKVIGFFPPAHLVMPHLPHINVADLGSAQIFANQINPSILAADSQYQASAASIGVAKSSYFPRLTFDLTASYDNNLDGVRGHNNDAMALIRMNYNLFNGGSDRAAVDAATARKMEALHDAQNTRREINEGVAFAWNGLKAARQRLPYLKIHAQQSLYVSEAYKKQFTLGQRTLFDLLNAETEYFDASSNYVTGHYEVKVQVYRLLAAMGDLVNTIHYYSAAKKPVALPLHKKAHPPRRKSMASVAYKDDIATGLVSHALRPQPTHTALKPVKHQLSHKRTQTYQSAAATTRSAGKVFNYHDDIANG